MGRIKQAVYRELVFPQRVVTLKGPLGWPIDNETTFTLPVTILNRIMGECMVADVYWSRNDGFRLHSSRHARIKSHVLEKARMDFGRGEEYKRG
jgi:hypothetical protein